MPFIWSFHKGENDCSGPQVSGWDMIGARGVLTVGQKLPALGCHSSCWGQLCIPRP